ncbi:hypothetical protein BOVATA_047750 [Babesia ovata]|uniref:Uncharacterized protein n=1 Tax=Babesia ovata TaxID=189622 RepID=A0A2H6KJW6_9APIC|nr:uncharacterized protein BOVATA_047750 [Babesia ovata]GBE63282.1 hypothetical protein BOVATA_047750 [Babesia ovata]
MRRFSPSNKEALHVIIISPLVAVAPLPAAHHRRPPRRPEDTLTCARPQATASPRSHLAAARQGTRQRSSASHHNRCHHYSLTHSTTPACSSLMPTPPLTIPTHSASPLAPRIGPSTADRPSLIGRPSAARAAHP